MTADRRIALLDGTLLPEGPSWGDVTKYVADVRSGAVVPCELPGSTTSRQYKELQQFLNDEAGTQLPPSLNSGYGLDRLRWVAYPDPSRSNLIFAGMSPLSRPEEGIEQAQATLELFYMSNRERDLRTKLTDIRFAAVNHAGIVCAEYRAYHSDQAQAPNLVGVNFSSHQVERDTLTMMEPYSVQRPYYINGLTTNTMTAVNSSPLFHIYTADSSLRTLQRNLADAADLFTTSVSGDNLKIRLHGAASQIRYVIPMHLVLAAAN